MRVKVNNRNGAALALVLIVMAILMILGTSALQVAISETNFSQNSEDKIQAYYAARSGAQAVAEYIIKAPSDDYEYMINRTSDWNEDLDKGKFKVEVKEVDTGTIEIISTGEYRDIQQVAKILLKKNSSGIFEHAIVGQDIILTEKKGNKIIILGTIATKENAPDIGEKVIIYDKNMAVISPPDEPDETLFFPEIIEPDNFDETHNGLTLDGKIEKTVDATLNEKNIKINGDFIMKNATLTVKGGDVHLYVSGSITIESNASMKSIENGRLFVYVSDPEEKHTIYFSGSGEWNSVFIYAPNSTIDWQNAQPNGKLRGALIGNRVLLKNQYEIIYDANLAKESALSSESVGVWNSGYVWVD